MTDEKMREEFEAKYALPAGLYWCEQSSQYVGHPQFWLFTDRLEVWINSRAAIEVELPGFVGYQEHIVRELQAAFKASAEVAGLKVKP